MRRALPAALLVLLLGAPGAFASKPYVTSVATPEEQAPTGYHEASGNSEVLTLGALRVTVHTGALKAPRGYTPVEVVLQNAGPVPVRARLFFQGMYGNGNRVTERTVEVAPRQRLVTWLHVPAVLQAGNLSVDVPGQPLQMQPVYLDDGRRGALMVLGTAKSFEALTGLPKTEEDQSPLFAARFIDPKEAPRELSAYVGYPVVAVTEEALELPADVWAVLETYAATGGTLVLPRPPRDLRERLPLLPAGGTPPESLYGFGLVHTCDSPVGCGTLLASAVSEDAEGPVKPMGPPPRWERGNALRGGHPPLLSSARAPVGRFLLLIFAFALAVGPGALALSRRKGPVAVLVVVPLVSLVTCLALVSWSVLVDGFAVHAARYSLTWLDSERSRAVTLGVGAWYANLAPDPVKLPVTSALLAPDDTEDSQADLDWTEGLTVERGFLPARTYREWGEVAVLPSRARLVLRGEGDARRVQNALGARLEEGLVKVGGAHYRVPVLEDGAEAPLGELVVVEPDWLKLEQSPIDRAGSRLLPRAVGFTASLEDGGFLVRVGGVGPAPTAAVPVELEEGMHLVRGRVEEVRP
ncbi:MAG TPA: hypothetical protein VE153_13665 [Myxococcus sp.]|nr:hypothetical protein [Myxococcus sp.]